MPRTSGVTSPALRRRRARRACWRHCGRPSELPSDGHEVSAAPSRKVVRLAVRRAATPLHNADSARLRAASARRGGARRSSHSVCLRPVTRPATVLARQGVRRGDQQVPARAVGDAGGAEVSAEMTIAAGEQCSDRAVPGKAPRASVPRPPRSWRAGERFAADRGRQDHRSGHPGGGPRPPGRRRPGTDLPWPGSAPIFPGPGLRRVLSVIPVAELDVAKVRVLAGCHALRAA
jgi:hypothetical protein